MGDYASWLRTERQALLTLYGLPTCEANMLTKENLKKIEAGAKYLYPGITVDEYFKRPIITRETEKERCQRLMTMMRCWNKSCDGSVPVLMRLLV
jgi:hypothetical protein